MSEVVERMNRRELAIIAVSVSALMAAASLTVYARIFAPYQYTGYSPNQGYGHGGMMGSYPNYSNYGPGMMGSSMMQGMGPGMMGGTPMAHFQGYGNYTQGMMSGMPMMRGMMGYYPGVPTALTHDSAVQIAESYLASISNSDLVIDEFEEYSHNFYVSIIEQSTGRGAFEVIIDRYTGALQPETQSIMWNAKYSMMRMMSGYSRNAVEMEVTPEEAMRIAQDYLDVAFPGTKASEITTYYGYYTIMTTLNGEHYGMLSINGFTGEVWYHTWHGMFISEVKE